MYFIDNNRKVSLPEGFKKFNIHFSKGVPNTYLFKKVLGHSAIDSSEILTDYLKFYTYNKPGEQNEVIDFNEMADKLSQYRVENDDFYFCIELS